jgi:hypothetical protein
VATVHVAAIIDLPATLVWEAVADVGAVHHRLLPGRVAQARIEGDTRTLTMPDGSEIRELIVAVDHPIRRLAYAVTGGQRLPLTYHHASFQVFPEGDRSRLVWLTDVLPHAMAGAVRARVERGQPNEFPVSVGLWLLAAGCRAPWVIPQRCGVWLPRCGRGRGFCRAGRPEWWVLRTHLAGCGQSVAVCVRVRRMHPLGRRA